MAHLSSKFYYSMCLIFQFKSTFDAWASLTVQFISKVFVHNKTLREARPDLMISCHFPDSKTYLKMSSIVNQNIIQIFTNVKCFKNQMNPHLHCHNFFCLVSIKTSKFMTQFQFLPKCRHLEFYPWVMRSVSRSQWTAVFGRQK